MRIFLVGMPGSGKTRVARELASLLDVPLLDTDALVEGASSATIPQIFERFGEDEFRRLERAALRKACEAQAAVIATGGGAVTSADNISAMREAGTVVWLDVSARVAHRRTRGKGRPLLDAAESGSPRERVLERLLQERTPRYEAAAHHVVDAETLSPEMLAEQILSVLGLHAVVHVALRDRSYPIVVGAGMLEQVGERLAAALGSDVDGRRAMVVSDENVDRRYGAVVARGMRTAGFKVKRVCVTPGERSKSWTWVRRLHTAFDEARLDRQSPVVAVGGGVVGDLTGFAASIWLRGVPLVHVPTTLLAQVDSAIGGKTAINHSSGKNRVGTFYQPLLVVADPTVLATLPDEEYRSGLGEVMKYGVAMDRHLFDALSDVREPLRGRDQVALMRTVLRAVALKAGIVSRDEREGGVRAVLNAGHTIGHALEAATGYRRWRHGEAVAIGLVQETRLAVQREWAGQRVLERVRELIESYELPATARARGASRYIGADKKRAGDVVASPLIKKVGRARLVDVPVSEWKSFVRRNLEP